jgi:2-polyprenyl-3-methyl-5-hydroxy-6-metoxy-1,4-benzoquinol methylase
MFAGTSMPSRDWWAALFPDPSGLLRTLGVREDMTALDLCCGDGYFTAPLARIIGGRVYALDFDPDLIARARGEAEYQGVTVRQWITADARDLAALLPEPVDFVLLANTLHGVPDKPALAQAIAPRCGRPGSLRSSTGIPDLARKRPCSARSAARLQNCACRRRARRTR